MASNLQKRKIVYFLGAGASYAAGSYVKSQGRGKIYIPTQSTFWDTFLRFCHDKKNRRTIESFLFRYFRGYRRLPSRLPPSDRRRNLEKINVEEVFTFLSERIFAPGTSDQLRSYSTEVWAALINEIVGVFERFGPNAKSRQIYRALLDNHVKSRDAVVSFNYDTVFEHSLPAKQKWFYDGIEAPVSQGLRLLKPHGSINWGNKNKKEIEITDSPSKPIIVAPTHLKFAAMKHPLGRAGGFLDGHEQIKAVWAEMERQMSVAKALVFIGYSFPPADLYFSSVLRSVLAKRDDDPKIIIVNPDAVEIQKRLAERFSLRSVNLHFDFETFITMTRKQILKTRN